jgi:hypothetical protein
MMRAQRALITMLLVCAILGIKLLHGAPGMLEGRLYFPVIFATSLLTLAFTLRRRLVLPSLAELRGNPRDPALLRRWAATPSSCSCCARGWGSPDSSCN